jgi:hypothetical protein
MKKFFGLFLSFVVIMPALALAMPALAQNDLNVWGPTGEDDLRGTTGLGNKDPQALAASVINVLMTFLGIIAVVIILLGGFKWMTAGGNEEKVEESKKLIRAGIIGLVIILAAWGIASYVVNTLVTTTTA